MSSKILWTTDPLMECIIADRTDAVFPLADRIFLGEALVETMRVAAGKPCFANAHWQRLTTAARALGIDAPITQAVWHQSLERCLAEHPLVNGGIKIYLSAGLSSRGLGQQGETPRLVLQPFDHALDNKPLSLMRAPWARDALNPIYRMKSVSYLESIAATRQANAKGFDDVVFFNVQGHATETTIANVFVLLKDTLYTPPLHDGVLDGVMRAQIMRTAPKAGILVMEQSLSYEQLKQAEGMFLSNAIKGMIPVECFGDHRMALPFAIMAAIEAEISSGEGE